VIPCNVSGRNYYEATAMLVLEIWPVWIGGKVYGQSFDGVCFMWVRQDTPSLVMGACSVDNSPIVVSGDQCYRKNTGGQKYGTSIYGGYHDE